MLVHVNWWKARSKQCDKLTDYLTAMFKENATYPLNLNLGTICTGDLPG